MILINSVQRTLIFIVIIAMLPSLVIILFSGIEERQKTISMIREEENRELDDLISRIKIKQASIYNTLRLLAQSEVIRHGSAKEAKKMLSFSVKENTFFSNLYLIAKSGKVIASLDESKDITQIIETPWMKKAMAGHQFHVSYPQVSKVNPRQLVVTYVLPVFAASIVQEKESSVERYLVGESTVLYDTTEVSIQQFIPATDYALTVRDEQGNVLIQPFPEDTKPFQHIDNDLIWSKVKNCKNDSGTIHLDSGAQKAYVVSYRRTSGYVTHEGHELTILLAKFISSNGLHANQVLTQQLLFLALTFFFSLSVALLLGRYVLINPIKRLLATIQEWTRGNYDARVKDNNFHGEMGQLVRAYNEMAAVINFRQKEILSSKLAAEAASKAKSEFIATISHELRTPMNAILGMTFLAMKADTRAKQLSYINKIYTAAKSLFGMINGVLDFSKIESEDLEFVATEFNPKEVLAEIITLAHNHAEEKGLKLRLHIANDVPEVLVGDPVRLAQALAPLLNNAIKFTEQGEVSLSCEVGTHIGQQVRLRFTVKDTGIGLSAEQQTQLFNTFSQVDSSLTRKFGGVGLGLAIAKSIIKMMDGTISVESELGKGSTFTLTAVFSPIDKERVKQLDQKALAKILVVDDDETTRYTLQSMLERMNVQVETTSSAQTAFAILADNDTAAPFHTVLMDWRMPLMDGIGATKYILTQLHLTNPPSIFITTDVGHPDPIKIVEKSGALGVIYKPITESILFDTISDALFAKGQLTQMAALPEITYSNCKNYNLGGISVLLVEDNPINQEVARGLLDSLGINVTVASSGDEAIDIINKTKENPPFTLILMDLQMPDKDGYITTQEIRKQWKKEHLPIIAMTAHTLAGDRARCYEVGMNDHIAKPIELDTFFSTLQTWANASVASKELNASITDRHSLTEDNFLNLPGINSATALARLENNIPLYYKILQHFLQLYTNSSVSFFDAFSNENNSEAQRIIHTLKGLAGSIGAEDLAKELAELELSLVNNERDTAEELALSCFNELDFVLEGLRQFFKYNKDAPVENFTGRDESIALSEEEKTTIADIFEKIETLLLESDPDVIALFVSQYDLLKNLLPQEVYVGILKDLERYELDDALKQIADYRLKKGI